MANQGLKPNAKNINYNLGITQGTNGAWLQKFKSTPGGVNKNFDAFASEFFGLLFNPILYFFR